LEQNSYETREDGESSDGADPVTPSGMLAVTPTIAPSRIVQPDYLAMEMLMLITKFIGFAELDE